MSNHMYSNIDLLIDEKRKEILINPKGERFYFVPCHEQHTIFRNAILWYNAQVERYEIEGEQTFYSEHKDMGLDYEKMVCLHPQELIVRKSFLGVVWYNVSGILKRELKTHYVCEHKEYRIHERSAVISQIIEEK